MRVCLQVMLVRFGVEVKNIDCSGEKMVEVFFEESKLEGL